MTQSTNNNIEPLLEGGSALETAGTIVCGGTKGRPALVGDILGDYREELVLGTELANEIRIYFNTEISEHKLSTLLSDRRYRVELERMKSCYGQPVFPGYYYGSDMKYDVYFASNNTNALNCVDISRTDFSDPSFDSENISDMYYIVKEGDVLSVIAKMYGITIEQIMEWNPQILNMNVIHPDQSIRIK